MSCSELAIKSAAYLAAGVSVHLSLSPPNPPVKNKNCAVPNTLFEKFIQSITFFTKSMVWVGVGWDLFATITSYMLRGTSDPRALAFVEQICHGDPSALWTFHPVMLAASATTVLAALLRVWCFKSLGSLFTFEISIRPEHALITSGPYAWVRHPSYTGVFMTLLGASALWTSPSGWIVECGMRSRLCALFITFWTIKCLFAFRGTTKRIGIEDRALRKQFGTRWDEWAKQVPQVLIPYVI